MQVEFCDPVIDGVITVTVMMCCQQMAMRKEHFCHEFVKVLLGDVFFKSLPFYYLLFFFFLFLVVASVVGKRKKNAVSFPFPLIIHFFPCIYIVNQEQSVRKKIGSLQ